MSIPPIDLTYIAERFHSLTREVVDALADSLDPAEAGVIAAQPEQISESMQQLLDILDRFEANRLLPSDIPENQGDPGPLSKSDLHELGNFGLTLLTRMGQLAERAGLSGHARRIEGLAFPLAVWLVRRGGEIGLLDPVVNSLAALANRTADAIELERLWYLIGEIHDAVSPGIVYAPDRSDPQRPWRLLLLNWGIVATRSHRPSLMERSFDSIVDNLPEDAPTFFREAMEQMEILNYPAHVRELVARYYALWGMPRIMH
jgi:hypothetical protein